MKFPKELVRIATLGTENSPPTNLDSGLSVVAMIRERENGNEQHQLLATVAGLRYQQLAGWKPPICSDKLNVPSEWDTQNVCNRESIEHLMDILTMLAGQFRDLLLPVWLKKVAQKGLIVPPEALPPLLEFGRKQRGMQNLIAPVLGQRADWLGDVATSDEWGWFQIRYSKARWEYGTQEGRVKLIEALRRTDPAHARQLVAETWATESKNTRYKFIRAFRVGLSHADEPFLEMALNDPSWQIRDNAIRLLSHLPQSAFRTRMLQRAQNCMHYERNRLKPIVRVKSAIDFDESMAHDGLKPDNSEALAIAVISYVDPQHWCDLWGISTKEFFEAIRRNKAQADSIWHSLKSAVSFTQNPTIAEALFEYRVKIYQDDSLWTWLVNMLPQAAIERCTILLTKQEKQNLRNEAHQFVHALDIPLSQSVASHYFKLVQYEFFRPERLRELTNHDLTQRIYWLAMIFPESMQEPLQSMVANFDRKPNKLMREIHEISDFCRKMLAAIESSGEMIGSRR